MLTFSSIAVERLIALGQSDAGYPNILWCKLSIQSGRSSAIRGHTFLNEEPSPLGQEFGHSVK